MKYDWDYRVVRWLNDGDALYEVMHVCFDDDGRPIRAIGGEPGQSGKIARLKSSLEEMMAALDADLPALLVEDIPDVPSRDRRAR